jgi:hypothetical protein
MENFKNPLAEAKFKRKKRNPITASSRTNTLLLPQQLVKGLPQKALTELLTVDLFPRTDLLLKLSRDLSCSQQALFHFSTEDSSNGICSATGNSQSTSGKIFY